MKQISLILSTFSFAAANIVAPTLVPSTSPALAQTAGCGSGWSNTALKYLSLVGSRQFRVACDEHDVCYDTFGKSKQDCDKAFHNRMLGICARDHNTIVGIPARRLCNGRADAYYTGVLKGGQDKYDKAQAAARPSTRFKPSFYSRVGMNPPGIIYLWPSPGDGGKTDVWCDVPNHSMYARNIDGIGRAIGVDSLEAVKGTAKYWSQPCTDDIFRQSRIQR